MKIQRVLSPKQIRRFKYLCSLTLCGILFNFISDQIAVKAQLDSDPLAYSGPFYYEGTLYEYHMHTVGSGKKGYIEEYTNKNTFCVSELPIIVPGTSLMNEAFLGIVYLLVLFWFFLGIAIVADIFMEAIEVITSKSDLV